MTHPYAHTYTLYHPDPLRLADYKTLCLQIEETTPLQLQNALACAGGRAYDLKPAFLQEYLSPVQDADLFFSSSDQRYQALVSHGVCRNNSRISRWMRWTGAALTVGGILLRTPSMYFPGSALLALGVSDAGTTTDLHLLGQDVTEDDFRQTFQSLETALRMNCGGKEQ
ncbi:MAG: hypothetical protein ACOCWQ_05705 [Nanoarchaeota archaeon]